MQKHKEIIAELRREVAIRRRVFPNWVRTGRMKQADADSRIELMQAAIELIESKCENNQQTLFSAGNDRYQYINMLQRNQALSNLTHDFSNII
jgi:hypothetical protein